MIAAIWGTTFWALLGLFFGGVGVAFLVVVWRASRHTYLLALKRRQWESRHARNVARRRLQDDDYQAMVLRRIRLDNQLEELRAEILSDSQPETLRLVEV